MSKPPTPVHYLRENARNWSPAAVIFADTETQTVASGEREVLGLRCWTATFTDRRAGKGKTPRAVTSWGVTAPSFARWITDVTADRDSVWLFTHNLAFDLTTTRAPLTLLANGWRISDAAIGGRAPWMRLGRGKRVLTMVDSGSWLPAPLDEIGVQLGLAKPKLPAERDDLAAWLWRCRADTDILAQAMLSLMAWWDACKLGNWSISGNACGWNAYRHRPTTSRVVIDPDPAKVKRDREYVHGGRRGVWSIGGHAAGPFIDLDFRSAYPTIAAHCPHPIERAWAFDSMAADHENVTSERWGITARCLIETDTPRWPVRIDGATWYPVGQFWADLAGPDIREARRLGALRQIGPGEVHRLDTNMGPWARWVLDVAAGTDRTQPPVAAMTAKHWGRAVIGKWSQHAFERVPFGPAPTDSWAYEPGWDHETQTEGGWLDLAGQRWWTHGGADPENAYPAVHAWIEAEVRVRLGRVIDAIGPGAVLQCDTDGLIVAGRLIGTPAAHGHLVAPQGAGMRARLNWVLDNIDPVTAPLSLRVKGEHAHVHIQGPQHWITDRQRKLAGIRRDAVLNAAGQYEGRLWPGMKWQLQHGDPRGYVRPLVLASADGLSPTGWITAERRVVPVETTTTREGRTVIVPWHLSRYPAAGLHRSDTQHERLDALI